MQISLRYQLLPRFTQNVSCALEKSHRGATHLTYHRSPTFPSCLGTLPLLSPQHDACQSRRRWLTRIRHSSRCTASRSDHLMQQLQVYLRKLSICSICVPSTLTICHAAQSALRHTRSASSCVTHQDPTDASVPSCLGRYHPTHLSLMHASASEDG